MTTTRRIRLDASVKPLASPFYELAPTPVQETSLDFAHALDGFRARRAEARAARDAIKAVASVDQQAALDAARAGKPIPAPKSDKARDHADRLLRETEAAQVVAEEKLAAFVDALAAHRDEIDEAGAPCAE